MILGNVRQNITSLAESYPDVTFHYFFTPYSGAWWQSYINTGKVDTRGNQICYSFVSSFIINVYSYTKQNKYYAKVLDSQSLPVLYNGKFKKYRQVFTANGSAYDSFTLSLLDLTTSDKVFVDHRLFNVYIQTIDNKTGKHVFESWVRTDNLVLNAQQDSKMYQLRLNQEKQYVLKILWILSMSCS